MRPRNFSRSDSSETTSAACAISSLERSSSEWKKVFAGTATAPIRRIAQNVATKATLSGSASSNPVLASDAQPPQGPAVRRTRS
ncbi:hypothetical protein [Streptomyces sp. NPDC054834]